MARRCSWNRTSEGAQQDNVGPRGICWTARPRRRRVLRRTSAPSKSRIPTLFELFLLVLIVGQTLRCDCSEGYRSASRWPWRARSRFPHRSRPASASATWFCPTEHEAAAYACNNRY